MHMVAVEFTESMNRSRHNILLFIALLLTWGQVLAAPFLPCQHALSGATAQQVEATAPLAGMNAQHATHVHEHAMPETAAAMEPATLHDHTSAAGDLDCRLHCVAAVILALPALSFAAGESPVVALLPMASSFLPPQPPAVHFRPPQYA